MDVPLPDDSPDHLLQQWWEAPLPGDGCGEFPPAEQQSATGIRSVLDGSTEPSKPKITFDPSPAKPFKRLTEYLWIAWSGALVPPAFLALMIVLGCRSGWDSRSLAVASLLLAVPAISGFRFYGRVSLLSSAALRLGCLALLAASVAYSVRGLRKRREVNRVLLVLFSVGILIFVIPGSLYP